MRLSPVIAGSGCILMAPQASEDSVVWLASLRTPPSHMARLKRNVPVAILWSGCICCPGVFSGKLGTPKGCVAQVSPCYTSIRTGDSGPPALSFPLLVLVRADYGNCEPRWMGSKHREFHCSGCGPSIWGLGPGWTCTAGFRLSPTGCRSWDFSGASARPPPFLEG